MKNWYLLFLRASLLASVSASFHFSSFINRISSILQVTLLKGQQNELFAAVYFMGQPN